MLYFDQDKHRNEEENVHPNKVLKPEFASLIKIALLFRDNSDQKVDTDRKQ